MNRNRWVPIASIATASVLAVIAVIAVVIGVSRRSNDGSASGPPSLGNREACTADYQIKLVRIALTAPLGSREVIDGSRTVPVPVTTNSPPFG